jgi:hypothetical protein
VISTRTGFARSSKPGCFEEYKAILTAIWQLAGGNPIVDLGCGEAHVTKHFDGIYVDLVVRPTAPAKTMQFDITEAPSRLRNFSYNLMVLSDTIEHLKPEGGAALLEGMDRLCRAQFVFTPIGPFILAPDATDPDSHKSAWYPEQFWEDGWEVLAYDAYHHFEGGRILGAFFAWKFRDTPTPPVEAVLQMAGIEL